MLLPCVTETSGKAVLELKPQEKIGCPCLTSSCFPFPDSQVQLSKSLYYVCRAAAYIGLKPWWNKLVGL